MVGDAVLGDAHQLTAGVGGGLGGGPRQFGGHVTPRRDIVVGQRRRGGAGRGQQRQVVDEQNPCFRCALAQCSTDLLQRFGDDPQRAVAGRGVELLAPTT